ncbi:DUF397 domain-containing protein [Streptomyces sp. NBC_01465]|uniref:DUF397 domain-containing protein n=1 Tax=Streptomyces sp. NBC_01465 TaxID=2903878 RepID=UPI002E2F7FDD|nr:DUF397 domain-containing protein [Streptomyces sp. NBC_01465]
MAIHQGAQEMWIKSSYSAGNGACVEVKSPITQAIAVRDSKIPEGPSITFDSTSWNTFVTEVARTA